MIGRSAFGPLTGKVLRTLSVSAGLLSLALFLSFSAVTAQEDDAWMDPKNCSTLKWVTGRLFLSNGTPGVRLRDLEARDTYGVHEEYREDNPTGDGEWPMVRPDIFKMVTWSKPLRGQFLICILHRQKGFFDIISVIDWKPGSKYEK